MTKVLFTNSMVLNPILWSILRFKAQKRKSPIQTGSYGIGLKHLEHLFRPCGLSRSHLLFTSTKIIRKSGKNRLFKVFLTYERKNVPISAQKSSSQYQPCDLRVQLMYGEHSQNIETTLELRNCIDFLVPEKVRNQFLARSQCKLTFQPTS